MSRCQGFSYFVDSITLTIFIIYYRLTIPSLLLLVRVLKVNMTPSEFLILAFQSVQVSESDLLAIVIIKHALYVYSLSKAMQFCCGKELFSKKASI